VSQLHLESPPLGGVEPLARPEISDLLEDARERTLWLMEPVSERDLGRVHDQLMSPLSWDLAHIAAFEELWICTRVGDHEPMHPDLFHVYDALETPRAVRGEVEQLDAPAAREYLAAVRKRSLDVLADADLERWGFVFEMVIQHEHQHNETMLQTLALAEPGVFSPPAFPVRRARNGAPSGMARIEAGPFLAGAAPGRFTYDNERPQHEVDLPAFEIDRHPVTNGEFAEFVEAGGYRRRLSWTEEGWQWRSSNDVERPLYWTADGEVRSFDRVRPLNPDLPVMHVSWFEADAYARWRGKRLPSELEWEKAAAWRPGADRPRGRPWGDAPATGRRANLDQMSFGPVPIGTLPDGASGYGVHGMIGEAWEWTASEFTGYDGFEAHPYREYSEVFFDGGYRVLRGASWATRPSVARNTFRNWDLPQRRQIFSGFRCAA
jgi:gamma-glutamyl hercynylcysteine S-oxide synthase